MRFIYQVAYWIGFTPWETPETPVPAVLREVIVGPRAIHSGRALDLGCGMGRPPYIWLRMAGTSPGWIRLGVHFTLLARGRIQQACVLFLCAGMSRVSTGQG
jgi:hypothetical protein